MPRLYSPFVFSCLLLAVALLNGCATTSISPPRGVASHTAVMRVTAYCNCQKCCGWEYSRFGFGGPVYASGPNKGKPKAVGLTASGAKARRGTVAADASVPFGTVVRIPEYGYGRVEDRGGAIKGNKLDLWFPSHKKALEWGSRTLTVTIWPASS
ncbi:MAG: 3D domain-containing protein [Kiritimatiellaeota bacterium]|nr:3D domain-containing protein [Kiritimatiellota bacterium]